MQTPSMSITKSGTTQPDYYGNIPNYANSPLPEIYPVVTITDNTPPPGIPGSGAVAYASVSNGTISKIYILSAGNGYSPNNTIATVTLNIGIPIEMAQLQVNVTNGYISSIDVLKSGSGYTIQGGIRKFIDSLAIITNDPTNYNTLNQNIPIAIPDPNITTYTFPNGVTVDIDYYEIELGEYSQQLHSDLPKTTLRGYRQTNVADGVPSKEFHYLGPVINVQQNKAVMVKFNNRLPLTEQGGDLFIPVDTTVMGAGMGPLGENVPQGDEINYTQNRGGVHLHGGITPWISDGTMHQWITPPNENTPYPKGIATRNVPGTTGYPTDGSMTFFYTNQNSSRFLFYHDHSYGITRLNVYAGEISNYFIHDPEEYNVTQIPPEREIVLNISDKTFVPSPEQLIQQDPLWTWSEEGGLWYPHVYMINQNPYDITGAYNYGRWDYGTWFWPPMYPTNGLVQNEYYTPDNGEPPTVPGFPNISYVPESFLDTPVVNGVSYPYIEVEPKAYRFRILNMANERNFNLQLYTAGSDQDMWSGDPNNPQTLVLTDADAGEVPMVPAIPNAGYPDRWPTDGRAGGVPNPNNIGPTFCQIGNEGGFLPNVAILPNTPIGYVYNRRDITVLNVENKTLLLGPAERADVIVDFSQFAGRTIILYNDCPAPIPGFDPRYDYYTGNPDQTDTGGAPTTQPGYGPNTRTILQFKVKNTQPDPTYDVESLNSRLQVAYGKLQPPPIIPNKVYNKACNQEGPEDSYVRIQDTTVTFFNGPLQGITLTDGGYGYTQTPTVSITGGGGSGATAAALINGITSIVVTNGGTDYTSVPNVSITGGDGSGATAIATISTIITNITVTNPGFGYTSAPNVVLSGGTGTGAAAVANVYMGRVVSITLTSPGVGYTQAPTVIFTGGGGTGAAAIVNTTNIVDQINITNSGSGYTQAPNVSITGGGGSGATAIAQIGGIAKISVTNGGSGYTSPTVTINDLTGAGASAEAILSNVIDKIDVIDGGSGYTSAPTVTIYSGGGSGATAHAIVDNITETITSIVVDRLGYGYVNTPKVSITGGGGSGAKATVNMTQIISDIMITDSGNNYTQPTVSISDMSGSGATADAMINPVTGIILTNPGTNYTGEPTVTISGLGTGANAKAIGITLPIIFKSIVEEFDLNYGRMTAQLGVEIPNTLTVGQVSIPYYDTDPPTELLNGNWDAKDPNAVTQDSVQIWCVTHNGVDTHSIHLHLVNFQLINRIGWDGAIRGPEDNEVGWKDTVRMNPLENCIIAIRTIAPDVPFDIPNSIRPLDVTMPIDSSNPNQFTNIDPTNEPANVINKVTNFGWEHMWHCHLLGHEENDMMRSMIFIAPPNAPISLIGSAQQNFINLNWIDNSVNEIAWVVERTSDSNPGPNTVWDIIAQFDSTTGEQTGENIYYVDTTVEIGVNYYYRVKAVNTIGYVESYPPPAVGYPNMTQYSVPSNIFGPISI